MRLRLGVILAAALLALAAGPATAATDGNPGELVPTILAADDPDVLVVETPAELDPAVDTLAKVIPTYCRTLSVARIHRTFLGFVAFKFWQRKRWCWRYPKVVSVQTSTYLTNVDPNYEFEGVVSAWGNWYTWCCGNTRSGHVSFREGKVKNCVLRIGCVGTYYPWVKIFVHGNGGYAYQTGE